jgi:hypothetical protein
LSLRRIPHNSHIVEVSSVKVGACGGQPQHPPQPSPITATARRAGNMIGAHHHNLGSGQQSRGARLQIQSDCKATAPTPTLQNALLLTFELSRRKPRAERAKLAVNDKECIA